MKPFALSLVEGLVVKLVVRQAHHERGCFTLWGISQLAGFDAGCFYGESQKGRDRDQMHSSILVPI
jgi:hypothetical protein